MMSWPSGSASFSQMALAPAASTLPLPSGNRACHNFAHGSVRRLFA
jgi:hypothetical protein